MRFRVFVVLIAAMTLLHFGIWMWSWPCVTNHGYFTLLPSQESKAFPAEFDDGQSSGSQARGTVGVVLSLPLFIPLGCLFWNNAKPIAFLVGFVNSLLWGIGLTCLLFGFENALYKRWGRDWMRGRRKHSEASG